MPLRITTWNVNGIRNPFGYQPWREKRSFQAMFEILEADIVIMQETKIQRKDLRDDMVLVPGWDVFFSLPKHKRGYSGVAIYTRNSKCCPIRAEEGITGVLCPPNSSTKYRDLPEAQQIGGYPRPGQLLDEVDEALLDSEGRCVILEFPSFVLIGTYSPANRDASRDAFRIGFLNALDVRVRNLVAAGKQVILTGDLNVMRSELDTLNVAENLRKEGLTVNDWMAVPARRLFNQLVFEGSVSGERDEGRQEPVLWDLCRCFHPCRQGMFTCWDTKKNTRPANNGSRIDYILCSAGIKQWFIDANIQEGLHGSDHCPVYATLGDVVNVGGGEAHLLDLMNPQGMFREGTRLREWSQKDLLPLSAKLIPEFDRRRSIRDMFMKKPSTTSTPTTPKPSDSADDSTDFETKPLQENKGVALETLDVQTQETVLPAMPEELPTTNSSLSSQSTTTTTRPEAKSSSKRPAEPPSQPKRTFKRTKTNESEASTKGSGGGFAQSTLKGFFKPKQTNVVPCTATAPSETSAFESLLTVTNTSPTGSRDSQADATDAPEASTHTISGSSSKQETSSSTQLSNYAIESAEKVFDPIQAKESWSRLQLGKRMPPKCEHGEPCISLVTKKPGVNCGRSFYICPRPLGPSGEKEKGTQWRCGTFIWSSDWKDRQ
ncbi:DNase I-like protein [Sodiomyces alkalinus F11]|uniref:DNA-(apurinic or apyrimidinic site) endonuclease 2 n=1 Tax=Sodiomyces alkalinus (strain CBS 110278 / VKM F-3762 / F11) TaxID=1314773 RepID=A0A3N2Q4K6_SODAK|nr:DNase I-like protein [Sodiomyces alkalinus F11]ROT41699.1 DNase I-like protein [Sodiomyces alkalinus F11]